MIITKCGGKCNKIDIECEPIHSDISVNVIGQF